MTKGNDRKKIGELHTITSSIKQIQAKINNIEEQMTAPRRTPFQKTPVPVNLPINRIKRIDKPVRKKLPDMRINIINESYVGNKAARVI